MDIKTTVIVQQLVHRVLLISIITVNTIVRLTSWCILLVRPTMLVDNTLPKLYKFGLKRALPPPVVTSHRTYDTTERVS